LTSCSPTRAALASAASRRAELYEAPAGLASLSRHDLFIQQTKKLKNTLPLDDGRRLGITHLGIDYYIDE
jgi:hypothetical protein